MFGMNLVEQYLYSLPEYRIELHQRNFIEIRSFNGLLATKKVIEFDGNTVLCRVCGDRASGFHYGVHACEGCKGFFRRSIQQKIQYRPCLKNQLCLITRVNRNRCQYCRLKKCIAVGMSRDAVRFGRVPKREKAKIMEQMQKVNIQCHGSMLDAILSNESELRRQIVDAHMKTCEFTRANFDQFYQKAWAQPDIVHCPAHMACPLNPYPDAQDGAHKWDHFSDCFMPAIRNVVSFAKCIPGFSVLSQEDQVTLLKAGTFEVLLVHLACLFDSKNNTMLFTNGKIFRRTSMSFSTGAGYLLDSMFDFAERFNELNLSDEEVALFSALVIISSDRPGLRGADLVEKLQASITRCLQMQMKVNHHDDQSVFAKLLIKVSELRMLNTVHSEKLLGLSVPPAEPHVPAAFPTASGCHSNSQMQLCFGSGYQGTNNGSSLESRGAGFEFAPRDLKSEDCGSKGEAIDLRGRAGVYVRGSSWWSTNQMLVGGDRDEKVGVYKSKMLRDDYDGRQRIPMPSKVLGDSNWLSTGVTNSDEKLPFSSHLSSPTSSHAAIQASTNSSSIIAHPSGTSIVARQVMMKTVQQEVILTTPVGTFHRTPLNLWTSSAVSTSNGQKRTAHREDELEMEADDGKRRDRQHPWKMAEDDEDSTMLDNSVISAKKKVMRTWSEDTSSSKLSCSSCCNSSKDMDIDVHSVSSLRPVHEQMDESLDDASSSSPDDGIASLQKTSKTTLEAVDLPVLKNALSASLVCPSGDLGRNPRISNGCHLTDSTSASDFQKQHYGTGDQFVDQRGKPKPSGGGSSGLLMSFADDRYRNAFIRSSATSPDSSCVTIEQTPRSLSSAFTAENLLRPNPNARNKVEVTDREAHLTTKATLKERLLKRIDSKDNVNSVEPTVGNGAMLGAPTGPDPGIAQRTDAFPLQFLHDYPRFYPLGFPGGLHPSVLYNHLALQHLQAVQQQQQHLQVQAQLTHAAMLGGILPKMTAAAAAENGPGSNAATGRSIGSPVMQSSSSEHLSLDDRSSECEEIKHLNTQAEHLTAQQSPLLVKSEMA